MDRRQFISTAAVATAATALALEGCQSANQQTEASGEAALGPIPTDQMTHRTGVHGEQVSILGYGCMRWPVLPNGERNQDGPMKGSDIDQDAVNDLVDFAMAHGVNYYDSSPVYCQGFSERSTGIALSRYPRESYYVATKMSNFDPSTQTLEESKKMYYTSLKELQVDYIDFYLLHAIGGGGMPALRQRFIDNGVLDFLLQEREAGRIKNLGWSYHGDIEVFDYMVDHQDEYHWDFVQIQLNYIDWHNEGNKPRAIDANYLYTRLAEKGIPAVIMEPLLGGRLASLNKHCIAMLKEREPQQTVASWAFRFAGQMPGVLTVLSGMTYREHLEDNLRTYAPFKPLSDEELALLDKVAHEFVSFPLIPCTRCQYCMPCPYGIDIPGNFTHYNRCLNEGLIQDDTMSPDFKKLRRQYLSSLDGKIEPDRRADHCIGCGQCKSHCPQRIDIPAQLRRLDNYLTLLEESL